MYKIFGSLSPVRAEDTDDDDDEDPSGEISVLSSPRRPECFASVQADGQDPMVDR